MTRPATSDTRLLSDTETTNRRFHVWEWFYGSTKRPKLIASFDEYDKAMDCALSHTLTSESWFAVYDIKAKRNVLTYDNNGYSGYGSQKAIEVDLIAERSGQPDTREATVNFDVVLDVLEKLISEVERTQRNGGTGTMTLEQAWGVCLVISQLLARGYTPTPDELTRFENLETRRQTAQKSV